MAMKPPPKTKSKNRPIPIRRIPRSTMCFYNLAGLHHALWVKVLLFLGLLLPPFGFIGQDIHFASSPLQLFMDFQYGTQRYLVLICALVALSALWRYDESPGMQAALRAAGIRPFEHLVAKHIAVFLLISSYQYYLTIYGWLLSLVWRLDPFLTTDMILAAQAGFPAMLAWAWANLLMVSLLSFLIRLIWMITDQLLLAYIGGITLLLAGITQPVWDAYFRVSPEIPSMLHIVGNILHGIVPPFWQFDLWLLRKDAVFETAALPHLLHLTLLASTLILLIHFASWCVTHFKRT